MSRPLPRSTALTRGARRRPWILAAAITLFLVATVVMPSTSAHHQGDENDTAYDTHYMVKGRVVNETGFPIANVQVNATYGGYGASVYTDCGGDFEAPIQVHQAISKGDVVSVTATYENESRSQTLDADPVTRRSDTVFVVPGETTYLCGGDRKLNDWEYRYTIAGRVADARGAHTVEGVKVGGEPVDGQRVNMTFFTTSPNGSKSYHIPVVGRGVLKTDLNGDFEYSYVLETEENGGWKITPETYGYVTVSVETVGEIANLTKPIFPGRYIYVNFPFGDLPDDEAKGFLPGPGALAGVGAMALAAVAVALTQRSRAGGGRP